MEKARKVLEKAENNLVVLGEKVLAERVLVEKTLEEKDLEVKAVFYGKGKGEEEAKGKGKGKSIICFWCNKEGHPQSKCRAKDEYINWIRSQNGGGGKGGGAYWGKGGEVNFWGQEEVKPEAKPSNENQGGASDLYAMENAAKSQSSFRYLGSFENRNRFSGLEVSGEEEDDEMHICQVIDGNFGVHAKCEDRCCQGGPPGLSVSKKKMPQWKRKGAVKLERKPIEICTLETVKTEMYWQSDKELVDEKAKAQREFKMRETKYQELMNLEDNREEYIEVTVDSGAADNVGNEEHAKICRVIPSEGSKDGVRYVSASGAILDNKGEKHVQIQTSGGHKRTMNMQIADVHRVLLSVSKICDAGNQVVFTRTGGKIINDETGEVDYFTRKDGVYRMKLKVIGDGTTTPGFIRPGQ